MVKYDNLKWPIRGHIILSLSPMPPYRGIDRNKFLPSVTQDLVAIDLPIEESTEHGRVWPLCPPGWKRDAYRLYEENIVPEISDDVDLIATKQIAYQIKTIIEPYLGPHEVVVCEISEVGSHKESTVNDGEFLGYDLAYLGGDYFSAIRAALFGSPWFDGQVNPKLTSEYTPLLNRYGLFPTTDPVPRFLQAFIEAAPSEANSDFYVWRMTLCRAEREE